jgi:hypothetical protein
MENRNNVLYILLVGITILLAVGLTKNYSEYTAPLAPLPDNAHICQEDSLRTVIANLQMDLENQEDGWDKKESRYEDILFEYSFGLDRLKETHPSAYKEFHRIIAYRERYSKEVERENIKRLQSNEQNRL